MKLNKLALILAVLATSMVAALASGPQGQDAGNITRPGDVATQVVNPDAGAQTVQAPVRTEFVTHLKNVRITRIFRDPKLSHEVNKLRQQGWETQNDLTDTHNHLAVSWEALSRTHALAESAKATAQQAYNIAAAKADPTAGMPTNSGGGMQQPWTLWGVLGVIVLAAAWAIIHHILSNVEKHNEREDLAAAAAAAAQRRADYLAANDDAAEWATTDPGMALGHVAGTGRRAIRRSAAGDRKFGSGTWSSRF